MEFSNLNLQIANNSIDPQLNSTNQNSNSNSNNTQSLSNQRLQTLLDRVNANNTNDFVNNENNIFSEEDDNGYQNIEELLESILFLISNEKTKIQNEKTNLITERQKFKEQSELQLIKHQKEIESWKNSLLIAESLKCNEEEIIDLDIGGMNKITTTLSTLRKYPNSALATLFSGRHKLPYHNGRIFIDRDGTSFQLMLQFLRNGKIPPFLDQIQRECFFEELDFWQIPIEELILKKPSPFFFDPEWCAETLNLEKNNKVINKCNITHGIIFCTPVMDEINNYIEFKVTMNIPCRGKSHLFIGVVDKSKYKVENLLSTFWKDCPSSFYWDAWNTKLIKIDENGAQAGSMSGYGCHCEDFETIFGIKYDYKAKTIEFYKNNANLGVAFRNVPSGLTPAIDIWFESGKVELLNSTCPEGKVFL